jgi:hypothetical protein
MYREEGFAPGRQDLLDATILFSGAPPSLSHRSLFAPVTFDARHPRIQIVDENIYGSFVIRFSKKRIPIA